MERTKRADTKKDTAKTTAPAPETPEQTEDTTSAQETPEHTEGTAPAQEVSVKTSQEEAAAIAAQIETAGVGKLDMGGSEETKPEQDLFAGIQNPCVYCGPTVRGVARQYTTYQGGIPDALRDFIKEHPDARQLIVSTAQFPAMCRRLDTPGTEEAKLYKAVKARL